MPLKWTYVQVYKTKDIDTTTGTEASEPLDYINNIGQDWGQLKHIVATISLKVESQGPSYTIGKSD